MQFVSSGANTLMISGNITIKLRLKSSDVSDLISHISESVADRSVGISGELDWCNGDEHHILKVSYRHTEYVSIKYRVIVMSRGTKNNLEFVFTLEEFLAIEI
jgi:hypothetical protein